MGGYHAKHLEAATVSADSPQQQAVVQALHLLKEQAQLELSGGQTWHHTAPQGQVLVVARTNRQRQGPVFVQKALQQQERGLQRVHLLLLVTGRRIILLALELEQADQIVLQLLAQADQRDLQLLELLVLQRAHQRQVLVQVHQTNLLLQAQVLLQRQ